MKLNEIKPGMRVIVWDGIWGDFGAVLEVFPPYPLPLVKQEKFSEPMVSVKLDGRHAIFTHPRNIEKAD